MLEVGLENGLGPSEPLELKALLISWEVGAQEEGLSSMCLQKNQCFAGSGLPQEMAHQVGVAEGPSLLSPSSRPLQLRWLCFARDSS